MARYNRFNRGIKFNHKVSDGGGIFNYSVFGVVGQIAIKLVATAKPHLLKSSSAVVEISSNIAGTAKRTFRRAVSVVLSMVTTAKGIRARRNKSNVTITATLKAMAKRNMFATGAINIVLNLIARLRQKYRPVYPRMELIEYSVNTAYTEYTISLEVVGMPYAGSTITLRGTFPDSAGDLAQLEDVALKVYSAGRTLLETIAPTEVSAGVYSGEYTIPADKTGQFDYEFSGVLGDKTIVGRSSFESVWR